MDFLGIIFVLGVVAFIAFAEGDLAVWIIFSLFTIGIIALIYMFRIDYTYLVTAGVAFAVGVIFSNIQRSK